MVLNTTFNMTNNIRKRNYLSVSRRGSLFKTMN